MKTTRVIEKYELRINSVIKKILEIQMTLKEILIHIEGRDGIKAFSEKNPEKIEEAVAKLTEARKILSDSIGLLLNSGNPKKNP